MIIYNALKGNCNNACWQQTSNRLVWAAKKYICASSFYVTCWKVEQRGTTGKSAAVPGRHTATIQILKNPPCLHPFFFFFFPFCTVCCEKGRGNSQFYGLVPHDDVTRQDERLDVDDVRVSALRPHVQPFALEGKVAEGDPGETRADRAPLEMKESR